MHDNWETFILWSITTTSRNLLGFTYNKTYTLKPSLLEDRLNPISLWLEDRLSAIPINSSSFPPAKEDEVRNKQFQYLTVEM